jgi:hypothetical protein
MQQLWTKKRPNSKTPNTLSKGPLQATQQGKLSAWDTWSAIVIHAPKESLFLLFAFCFLLIGMRRQWSTVFDQRQGRCEAIDVVEEVIRE